MEEPQTTTPTPATPIEASDDKQIGATSTEPAEVKPAEATSTEPAEVKPETMIDKPLDPSHIPSPSDPVVMAEVKLPPPPENPDRPTGDKPETPVEIKSTEEKPAEVASTEPAEVKPAEVASTEPAPIPPIEPQLPPITPQVPPIIQTPPFEAPTPAPVTSAPEKKGGSKLVLIGIVLVVLFLAVYAYITLSGTFTK